MPLRHFRNVAFSSDLFCRRGEFSGAIPFAPEATIPSPRKDFRQWEEGIIKAMIDDGQKTRNERGRNDGFVPKLKMKKTTFKRAVALLAAMVLVSVLFTSCVGSNQQITTELKGDVKLNDEDGISQNNLNEIAEFLANNKEAYEGVVAAYRGYNYLSEKVEAGKEYPELFETVIDENGDEV